MSLGFSMNNQNPEAQKRAVLRHKQCGACPLAQFKQPHQDTLPKGADIMIISEMLPYQINQAMIGYPTFHTFRVECATAGVKATSAEGQCCLGRKVDQIAIVKPKLVICIGAKVFNDVEDAIGNDPERVRDMELYPTQYAGHEFWMMPVPDFNTRVFLMEAKETIRKAINTKPVVHQGNFSGIEIVQTKSQLDAAVIELCKNEMNAIDVETHNEKDQQFRPYYNEALLLTAAMGTKDKVFAFPIMHPQAPETIQPTDVLRAIWEVTSKTPIVGHNIPFDLEWLGYYLGIEYLFLNQIHDTMGQAYLLSRGAKNLDSLVRRYLGFNIKKLSGINAGNLKNTPIERVLSYNGMDVKYTHQLWYEQNKTIQERDMQLIYDMQMERIPASVVMQLLGMLPNKEFIEEQTPLWRDRMYKSQQDMMPLPEVQKFMAKYGSFNPGSQVDVPRMYKEFLGVSDEVKKFDKEFLKTRKNEKFSELLSIFRKNHKMYGTYLAPICPGDPHESAGKNIMPDGMVHAIFNTMLVITGRLSSDSPNMQNWPKRGQGNFIRNVFKAPEDYYFVAIDYGQIEYRIIAAISRAPEMVKALREGLDIHMFWAEKLMQMYPDYFVKENNPNPCTKEIDKSIDCLCKKCAIKAFRNECKNKLVFPMCFGSSPVSICESLNLTVAGAPEAIEVEFWSAHPTVKEWQDKVKYDFGRQGWIQNIFGRRYYAPIKQTELINYPIQGGAIDLILHGMSKIAREGVITKNRDIIPRINIHDDLSFYIKKEYLNDALAEILPIMLDTRDYPWLPIALTAEVSVGETWGALKELITVSSDKFYPLHNL